MNFAELLYRLSVAVVLGAIIGLERQWKSRTAGLRTNVLVSIGASSFIIFGLNFPNPDSLARIASYVVSGMGFLGAGVIMRDGGNVKGINTAATLWCSAAIGMFTGMGMMLEALVVTFFVFFSNMFLSPIVRYINHRPLFKDTESEHYYAISITCKKREEMHIRELLTQHVNDDPAIHLRKLESKKSDVTSDVQVSALMASMGNYNIGIETVVGRLSLDSSVKSIAWTSKTDLE